MLIQFFIIMLFGAVGSFYLGLKYQRWLLTMFSAILFFVLAFQAFKIEVVTGGVNLVFQEISLVLLMWFAGFAASAFTLVGVVNQIKQKGEKKNYSQPYVPGGVR